VAGLAGGLGVMLPGVVLAGDDPAKRVLRGDWFPVRTVLTVAVDPVAACLALPTGVTKAEVVDVAPEIVRARG